MDEKFWTAEPGWVLLRGHDHRGSLMPYNVKTGFAVIVDRNDAPTVVAMLNDGITIIDREDPRFPNPS